MIALLFLYFIKTSIVHLTSLGIIFSIEVLMMVYQNRNVIVCTFFHNKFLTLDYVVFQFISILSGSFQSFTSTHTHIYIYIYIYIFKSYILDASKEVISDALFSSPISGSASYRLQQQPRHGSWRVKPPPWLRRATHRNIAKTIKKTQ